MLIDMFLGLKPMHWIFIGGAVTVLGTCITLFATFKHNQSSSKKTDSIRDTGVETNTVVKSLRAENGELKLEVHSLRDENLSLHRDLAKSQERIITSQDEIGQTQERTIRYLDGHDSYCTVEIFPELSGKADVFIHHIGKYPLYNINVSIFNSTEADKGKPVLPSRMPITLLLEQRPNHEYRKIESLPTFAELQPGYRRKIGTIDCKRESYNSFMITVSARNGVWYERYMIWPDYPNGGNFEYNRCYKVLKVDPSNPESSPSRPKTLKEIKGTSLPEFIIDKINYDWYKNNWF